MGAHNLSVNATEQAFYGQIIRWPTSGYLSPIVFLHLLHGIFTVGHATGCTVQLEKPWKHLHHVTDLPLHANSERSTVLGALLAII